MDKDKLHEEIQIGGLYKLKEGKSVDSAEEYLSKYVLAETFISNPLEKEKWYVGFIFRYKDNLEPTTHIHPFKMLSCNDFRKYFELDMPRDKVNDLIRKLNEEETEYYE